MKFIRDIISEKRAGRQAGLAAAPSRAEAMPEPDLRSTFRESYDPVTPGPVAAAAPPASRNIFAFDAEDADTDLTPIFAEPDPQPVDAAEPEPDVEPGHEPARDVGAAIAAAMQEDEDFTEGFPEADATDPWPEAPPPRPAALRPAEPDIPLAPLYLDRTAAERLHRTEAAPSQAPSQAAVSPRPAAPVPAEMPRDEAPLRFTRRDEPTPAPARAEMAPLSEMPFVSVRAAEPAREPAAPPAADLSEAGIQMPPPAAGRGSNRSGRVKTRLLGFNPDALGPASPFERAESRPAEAFPVGWLVVVAGPGRGASFPLHDGVSRIGRGEDQTVSLNFGDNSISRENHVSVAYDSEQNAFFIGQSGRSNIVRLNNKPLLSTEQIRNGDQIRVGETTLRLAALCSDGFSWAPRA